MRAGNKQPFFLFFFFFFFVLFAEWASWTGAGGLPIEVLFLFNAGSFWEQGFAVGGLCWGW